VTIGNQTIDLGLRTDGLTDSKRRTWINQEKSWMGVMNEFNLTD